MLNWISFSNSSDEILSASLATYLDYHRDINVRNPVIYAEFYTLNSSYTCC